MLIILLLAFSNMVTYLSPLSVGCVSAAHTGFLSSALCHFDVTCTHRIWLRVGGGAFERQTQISFLFIISQMTSSTVCALPSPVTFPPLSVMKWSRSLLLGDVERKLKVLYLTDIWLQMFNK